MDNYALSRLEVKLAVWCWLVHFRRRGEPCERRFYDRKCGGEANARKAALAWRDQQLKSIEALSLLEFCQQRRRNNTSGVAGVHLLVTARQPEGVWQAKLKLGGVAKHKSFSVRKHGSEGAFKLAVAARLEMLSKAPDAPYLYDQTAIEKTLARVN